MADVQAGAARVGEHVEDVELRLARDGRVAGVGRAEGLVRFPELLPPPFDVGGVVARHGVAPDRESVSGWLMAGQAPGNEPTPRFDARFSQATRIAGRQQPQAIRSWSSMPPSFWLGLVILVIGAEALIRGSVRIARALGVSPFVIGFTLRRLRHLHARNSSSACRPRVKDSPELALGNIVGSNIANIGLILALAVLVRPLAARMRALWVEVPPDGRGLRPALVPVSRWRV